MKFRKKPVVIEAIQFKGKQFGKLDDVLKLFYPDIAPLIDYQCDGEDIKIITLEGRMLCVPGDYIIKGIKGEFYPCKPDIFEATYEAVEC
jgi:hypothetical protein